jgi:hypothetical protein
MLDLLEAPLQTLASHVGAGAWAMAAFFCGFPLAVLAVRHKVRGLLAMPLWIHRLGKKYLTRQLSPAFLFAFIFLFNTIAIFVYMVSGGLVILPVVCAVFTGLNVCVITLVAARESAEQEPRPNSPPARAWVGFLSLFSMAIELPVFWLAVGMGIKLGRAMEAEFTWAAFVAAAEPRVIAYVLMLVPALALAALAEAISVTAMIRAERQ